MVELIKFIFSDFWIFLGSLFLMAIIAYAIANLRIFTFVKEEHNETINNGEGLSEEDKQFIAKMSNPIATLDVTDIKIIHDINFELDNPNPNVLYLIRNPLNKYTVVRYSENLNKFVQDTDNVNVLIYSKYNKDEKEIES